MANTIANTIIIKNGTSNPSSGTLQANELGFNKANNALFMGKDGAAPIQINTIVSVSEPVGFTNGFWFNPNTNIFSYYNGTDWVEILPNKLPKGSYGSSVPDSGVEGQMYFFEVT